MKFHNPHFPHECCKWCEFGCDQSIINSTLHWEDNTSSDVTCLPLKGFFRNSVPILSTHLLQWCKFGCGWWIIKSTLCEEGNISGVFLLPLEEFSWNITPCTVHACATNGVFWLQLVNNTGQQNLTFFSPLMNYKRWTYQYILCWIQICIQNFSIRQGFKDTEEFKCAKQYFVCSWTGRNFPLKCRGVLPLPVFGIRYILL